MLLYSPPSDEEILAFLLPPILMVLTFLAGLLFMILSLTTRGPKRRGFGVIAIMMGILFFLFLLIWRYLN